MIYNDIKLYKNGHNNYKIYLKKRIMLENDIKLTDLFVIKYNETTNTIILDFNNKYVYKHIYSNKINANYITLYKDMFEILTKNNINKVNLEIIKI